MKRTGRNQIRLAAPLAWGFLLCCGLGAPGWAQDASGRDVPSAKPKPTPKPSPAPVPAAKSAPPKIEKKVEKKADARPAKTQAASVDKPTAPRRKAARRAPAKAAPAAVAATPPPAASSVAKLTISAPQGSLVELDGKMRGMTGIDGHLVITGVAPGDHALQVIAEGYEPWRGTFVMSTASTRFDVPIRKRSVNGVLALTSNESGTEILLDAKPRGSTGGGLTATLSEIPPGTHEVRARKPGFRDWTGTVTLRPTETLAIRVELKRILDPEMVLIPAGVYTQGNNRGDKDQRPEHEVFTPAFEIARVEVTNQLYKFFVDATRREAPRGVGYGWTENRFPEGQGDQPVVYVTWEDAVAFCKWLSAETGRTYRLPTEAEWEKAARIAGDTYASVGKVWEWCQDWYDPDYYKRRERFGPQGGSPAGPPAGKRIKMLGREGETRVMRGGGFGRGSVVLRAAERNSLYPTMVRFDVGFRVVREVSK